MTNAVDAMFLVAIHDGPYLVLTEDGLRGFRTLPEAEAYAADGSKSVDNDNPCFVLHVEFNEDGSPFGIRCLAKFAGKSPV